MSQCQHQWKMTNIEFGFTVCERCAKTQEVRTYFSLEDTWDQYVEGDNYWTIVENAQTFRFDLKCTACNRLEKFDELMGIMYCPGCTDECKVEIQRKKGLASKTFVLVAFGFLPQALSNPLPQDKLDVLSEHFNQRRDTRRSTIKIIPFTDIEDISQCKGEFIRDVGMLSLEPEDKKTL